MPTARVTRVGDSNHLILSNCPVCDRAHESVLHTAEGKVTVGGDVYPHWSSCPSSPLDTILIRFVKKGGRGEGDQPSFDIGMVVLHRDDPIFHMGTPD